MDNDIYICPKCGATYGSAKGVEKKCSDCGLFTISTGITEQAWYAKSKDERDRIKSTIYIRPDKSATTSHTYGAAGSRSDDSGWASLLRGVATFWLILGCIASLVSGILVGSLIRGGAGFFAAIVIIAAGVFLSFVSVAAIMVFLDVSSDIRSIKLTLDNKQS